VPSWITVIHKIMGRRRQKYRQVVACEGITH